MWTLQFYAWKIANQISFKKERNWTADILMRTAARQHNTCTTARCLSPSNEFIIEAWIVAECDNEAAEHTVLALWTPSLSDHFRHPATSWIASFFTAPPLRVHGSNVKPSSTLWVARGAGQKQHDIRAGFQEGSRPGLSELSFTRIDNKALTLP